MKKIVDVLVVLLFILFVFSLPEFILAQSAQSNCVLTKVGNPSVSPPACGNTPAGIVKTAEDVMNAFAQCGGSPTGSNPLFTGDYPETLACLKGVLGVNGYTDSQLNAFDASRGLTSAPAKSPDKSVRCSQCVGYVKMVLGLINTANMPSAMCAGMYNSTLHFPNGIPAGNVLYRRIADPNAEIHVGDIAVKGNGCDPIAGNWGHILIVKSVNGSTFTALESNAGGDCMITGTRPAPRDGYTFYRSE